MPVAVDEILMFELPNNKEEDEKRAKYKEEDEKRAKSFHGARRKLSFEIEAPVSANLG